jgi:tRNA-intron endonuclease, archaea type
MEKIKAFFSDGLIFTNMSDESKALYDKSRFGELKRKKFYYSLLETLYLIENNKLDVLDGKNKVIDFDKFVKKAKKLEHGFWVRYVVFRDMRSRGYILKTALKFGADFRVYDRGIKPGEDHAKWVLYAIHEKSVLTWHEFSARNRVAHSTRKKLLIGVVDEEHDVTYYVCNWIKP